MEKRECQTKAEVIDALKEGIEFTIGPQVNVPLFN